MTVAIAAVGGVAAPTTAAMAGTATTYSSAAPVARAMDSAVGSQFNPGYIIDDSKFFNPNAMSVAEVQAFLNAKVPSCAAGYTCLRNYTETTRTIAATPMCSQYTGAASETAAAIIWKVGQACGVSPRAIIVMLQKEQGLVTKTAPSEGAFRSAMGAGCPDTAACDSNYYGFFNQVHYGSYLLKRYTQPAGTGPGTDYTTRFDLRYPVGQASAVLYNPNANCGSGAVYISNQATHALYLYTPYQPNGAALNNLYGLGDGCSSYGNRNFWAYYSDWFGSPTGADFPIGNLDSAVATSTGVSVRGWALDPNEAGPIDLQVLVDGAVSPTLRRADRPRGDVQAAYPGTGPLHGYEFAFDLPDGDHSVCVYGINVGPGANSLIGCGTVAVHNTQPFGNLDGVIFTDAGANMRGWAFDPNSVDSISLHVYVDGAYVQGYSANALRPDIRATFPSQGSNHGYQIEVPLTAGSHQVCIYGINIGAGSNSQIVCQQLAVPTRNPRGYLDSITSVPGGIALRGWTLDPSTPDSTWLHIYVDGRYQTGVPANVSRADVAAAFPGRGANHGVDATFPLSAGGHTICVYGLNIQGDRSIAFPCRQVSVPVNAAIGSFDALSPAAGRLTAEGWTLDRTTSGVTFVHVYVDGRYATGGSAELGRSDVGAAYPSSGPNHGFSIPIDVTAGGHTVCVYGFTASFDRSSLLGCRTAIAG